SVGEIRGRRGHAPVALAHRARLVEEVRQLAVAQPLRACVARREQLRARAAELALQQRQELGRFRGEDIGGVHRRASWRSWSAESPRIDASTSSIGWKAGSGRAARRRAAVTWTRQPGFPLAYASGSVASTPPPFPSPSPAAALGGTAS